MTTTPVHRNRRRRVIAAVVLTIGWGVIAATDLNAQLPPEITEDENIRVTRVTPEAALAQLQQEYAQLLRTVGADHPDAQGVAQQISQIRMGLAALGRPVDDDAMSSDVPAVTIPQSTLPPNTVPADRAAATDASASDGEEAELSLNPRQVQLLQDRYRELEQSLGTSHPMVQQLAALLGRLTAEVPTAPPAFAPAGSPAFPAAPPGIPPLAPSTVDPNNSPASPSGDPMLNPESADPYDLLVIMARRVVRLEQEVLRMRDEIQRLRDSDRDARLVPGTGDRDAGTTTDSLPPALESLRP
ncbi:hypothetical protein [Crateriforma conspicua]|uniref:Uncharacterized protein n=1 Tax=Crateriforma conspicua TaxID=2527996 RepID=A0A5C5Y2Y5_9PLAN|nr:hypothetical protein [Crateriforma conspicua]QDV64168.1 hypothetical protein Mal65_33180 [Crateriforma conspicua]TWT69560.1 hypothetical protein Pan14r_18480 [Crateriforma conspicua]